MFGTLTSRSFRLATGCILISGFPEIYLLVPLLLVTFDGLTT